MGNLWGREPAMVVSTVGSGLALAAGFGLDWTDTQQTLVISFVSLVLGLVTRSQVSPVAQA